MLPGLGGTFDLPTEQCPDIAPPTINVRAGDTGVSAEALENRFTQILEQRLTRLDGMAYFWSTSESAGRVRMTLTF